MGNIISTVANSLRSATTSVNVSAATAPTTGQVLTATGTTAATWQTPSGGGGSAAPFLQTNDMATIQDFASADQVTYSCISLAMVTGNVTKMSCYVGYNVSASAVTTELGIYNAARTTLLASGTVSVGAGATGIFSVTLGSSVALTAGTVYYLALLDRTSSGDQVRYAWGANNANTANITGFTTGNATMPGTVSSPSSTGRNYWIAAY